MRLRLTKPAQSDLDGAADWFGSQRPWLADRLFTAIHEAFARILESPDRFPRVEVPVSNSARDWRRVVLKQFSYIIVYFISGDTVVVTRICHASRDWTTTLSDKELE